MKSNFTLDTMTLILKMENRKFPSKIKEIFSEVEACKIYISISAMVLVEISYLSERSKIDTNFIEVDNYITKYSTIKMIDLTKGIIQRSFEIKDIPELHDRLISGTAKYLNNTLLTNDSTILKSKYVNAFWN